ncbi:PBECR2 nuclease fold domain-containing protein, partial [Helicobacter baculiformis]
AKRQREEFLPLIRPTLEEPNLILDDGAGLLFIKEFIDADKNRYFMSVAKNYNGEWIFSSHTKRQPSAIRGKIQKSKVLYNAGFKGGEVASASDILGSGGTAMKPSDLQIDTPPKHSSALNPEGELSTQELKSQALELHTTAKEQEEGFKELLEGLKGGDSTLEANNTLKSVQSIEEKLAYYNGDVQRVDDLLRGAFIAPKESINGQFNHILESLEANRAIEDISPRFIKTQDNYQGAHINFTYEGIPSEIQVHTPKSWETKKKQDPYYKELRREKLHPRLTKSELKKLRRRIRELGQESDLDISFFTSSKLTSPQYSPVQSELVTKSAVDLNATHEPSLNSKAGSSSESGTAYNRLESKLNQKSTSLTGGKGTDTDIETPLNESSTSPLKITPNPAFGEHFKEFEL